MHATSLLDKWLQRNAVICHGARGHALVRVVGALLSGGKLALTHLGRHGAGRAFVKHHIMAAVPVKGRAISIYEEVHPMRRYNNAKTHRRFLQRLHAVLPERCRPIIVTDAGFRGPWFRDVEALGWDLVGRIRNRIKYLKPGTGRWCFINSLYRQATPRVRHIGWRGLSRRHPHQAHLRSAHADRRRPFATSRATASGSLCATPERNAPSDSRYCGSSLHWPRSFCGCWVLPPPTANGPGIFRPTPNGAAPFSRRCSSVNNCGATIGSKSLSRSCSTP